MTNSNDPDRDKVLIAFHEECDLPTPADVQRWVSQYPQFAVDIRHHAAIRIATLAEAEADAGEDDVDDTHLARGRSRVHAALHEARTRQEETAQQTTLTQMISSAGLDIPGLARQLKIKRAVVADLVAGRMLEPGRRFVEAILTALGVTRGRFDAAYHLAISAPSLGLAKAQGQPKVVQRQYEDIIRTSGMDDADIRFWLEID